MAKNNLKMYPYTFKDIFIRLLRKLYIKIAKRQYLPPKCVCDRQIANDMIYDLLSKDEPCMIARFGCTELTCLVNYVAIQKKESYISKIINFITEHNSTPWWNTAHFQIMSLWSGIFPPSKHTAIKFSERYLQDIPFIDMLACYQYEERFMPLKDDILMVQLEMLYPFFVERPWTRILKGKKILVVHPFENSIRTQYKKRLLLFDNPDILPDFEILTLKAVQTVAGTKSRFNDWFEALEWMENEINKIDFDIAIIGCGAYGLPLAAHIKRMGKKAIHMAGGTQLLFGILGKRWTKEYPLIGYWNYRDHRIDIDYTSLFNDNWIYPLSCDTISEANIVEGACYWK